MANDAYTQETTRVVELKNKLGNTRFKVLMTDNEDFDDPKQSDLSGWTSTYEVKVIEYVLEEAISKNILISETYSVIEKARMAFEKYVSQYRALINAEEKTWKDITTYDEVHYHEINAACCKNCEYAKMLSCDQLYFDGTTTKRVYECMNPNLQKFNPTFSSDPSFVHDYPIANPKTLATDLVPIVYEDGICNDYKSAFDDKYRAEHQTDASWERTKANVAARRDAEMDYAINQSVNTTLKNIKIDVVSGNDNDANQNGIDDSQEIIIGNLGA